jgi:hypothetical protein
MSFGLHPKSLSALCCMSFNSNEAKNSLGKMAKLYLLLQSSQGSQFNPQTSLSNFPILYTQLGHCSQANKPCALFPIPLSHTKTRGVTHFGLAIYIKKYLNAKEEKLWKLKYFHHAKII